MADEKKLEARIEKPEHAQAVTDDIDAIKRLKYRYFRCLDSKLWNELAESFAEDATTSYSGGKYSFQGRDATMKPLSEDLGPTMISMHHEHDPEIEITSKTTAKGIWALQDCVVFMQANRSLRGASFYRDEYVKVGGKWKIEQTGYDRVFEETRDRGETKSLKITNNMFAPPQG